MSLFLYECGGGGGGGGSRVSQVALVEEYNMLTFELPVRIF